MDDTGREGCWPEPRELFSRLEPGEDSDPFDYFESEGGVGLKMSVTVATRDGPQASRGDRPLKSV